MSGRGQAGTAGRGLSACELRVWAWVMSGRACSHAQRTAWQGSCYWCKAGVLRRHVECVEPGVVCECVETDGNERVLSFGLFCCGGRYEGDFRDGKHLGPGIYTWPDGSR